MLIVQFGTAQKSVSITIDDVPNTRLFQQDSFNSPLLNQLDTLQIPITLFVNEGLLYKTDYGAKNLQLFVDWFDRSYTEVGNHTFSHSRYSKVDFDAFITDIEKGASISNELAKVYDKQLLYFRFPFNDMGKDAVQHMAIRQYLAQRGYQIAPFTIESIDWMYNFVYKHYLKKGDSLNNQANLFVSRQ